MTTLARKGQGHMGHMNGVSSDVVTLIMTGHTICGLRGYIIDFLHCDTCLRNLLKGGGLISAQGFRGFSS